MKLWQLTDEYLTVQHKLLQGEDVTNDLNDIKDNIADKLENCQHIRSEWQANIQYLKAEIDRLTEKKKQLEKANEKLAFQMREALIALDDEGQGIKVKGKTYSFTLSKPTLSRLVFADDFKLESLEEEYLKRTVTINKAHLKEDLKQGVYFEGVNLEETQTLRVGWEQEKWIF